MPSIVTVAASRTITDERGGALEPLPAHAFAAELREDDSPGDLGLVDLAAPAAREEVRDTGAELGDLLVQGLGERRCLRQEAPIERRVEPEESSCVLLAFALERSKIFVHA